MLAKDYTVTMRKAKEAKAAFRAVLDNPKRTRLVLEEAAKERNLAKRIRNEARAKFVDGEPASSIRTLTCLPGNTLDVLFA